MERGCYNPKSDSDDEKLADMSLKARDANIEIKYIYISDIVKSKGTHSLSFEFKGT